MRLRWMPVIVLSCLLSSPAWEARAQEPGAPPELVTDRPDQTESSAPVPRGTVQLEVGGSFQRFDDRDVRLEVQEIPGTLVRFGMTDRVELRLGWTGFVDQELSLGGSTESVDGAGDGELGVKVALSEERGRRPESAFLFSTSVPWGDADLTSDRFDPSFRFLAGHTLTDRLSFGYNAGMAWSSRRGARGVVETVSVAEYTAALGISWTERLGAFVELFGELPVDAPGGDVHSFDGGFTYLLRPNLQLDVSGGVGLTDTAADWFVGAGIAVRFPH